MTGQQIERYHGKPAERLSAEELKFIQNSELLPKAYRGKPADIFACVLLGRQLGIGDMHALRSIYVVDGKATIGAELMVTLIRRAGHSITAEYGDGQVTASGTRADNGDEMSVTWTTAMAQRAGLLGKNNWKAYPEAMLWARAVSQLGRMLFADVLVGLVYTPDEAELSPEERVSAGIGEVRPPDDDPGPDDSLTSGPGALTVPDPDVSDEPDVVEGHAVLVPEFEEEPQAGIPVSPAAPAPEPGSSSSIPSTEGQGSIFADMADKAQGRKRRAHKDPA